MSESALSIVQRRLQLKREEANKRRFSEFRHTNSSRLIADSSETGVTDGNLKRDEVKKRKLTIPPLPSASELDQAKNRLFQDSTHNERSRDTILPPQETIPPEVKREEPEMGEMEESLPSNTLVAAPGIPDQLTSLEELILSNHSDEQITQCYREGSVVIPPALLIGLHELMTQSAKPLVEVSNELKIAQSKLLELEADGKTKAGIIHTLTDHNAALSRDLEEASKGWVQATIANLEEQRAKEEALRTVEELRTALAAALEDVARERSAKEESIVQFQMLQDGLVAASRTMDVTLKKCRISGRGPC